MSEYVYIYVGEAATRNFEIGMKSRIWGWKDARFGDPTRAAYQYLQRPTKPTYIVFGRNIKPTVPATGWPRTNLEPWLTATYGEMTVARIVGAMYSSLDPVWPDAGYEHRVRFDTVTPLGSLPGSALHREAVVALRDSQHRRGNPVLGPEPVLDETWLAGEAYRRAMHGAGPADQIPAWDGGMILDEQPSDVPDRLLDGFDSLDGVTRAVVRLEQRWLRAQRFGKRTMITCAICARELPVGMVRLAHIKRRADADKVERLELLNTMPACTLGCDELFERGYIVVDTDGLVIANSARPAIGDLAKFVGDIADRSVHSYDPGQQRFFTWHRTKHRS